MMLEMPGMWDVCQEKLKTKRRSGCRENVCMLHVGGLDRHSYSSLLEPGGFE